MKIAAAQINPKDGDINKNLNEHYRLIELAAKNKVNLIVFPEMSITGYVRELAKELSFSEFDKRIDKLRNLAVDHDMIIIVGAPIMIGSSLHIGSFVLHSNGSLSIYTKQFLHYGEEDFFTPCLTNNPIIKYKNNRISLAICADITSHVHAENAHRLNTSIYVASIFYTPTAMSEAYNLLNNISKKFSMNVLMANYCGNSYGIMAGGKSALWSKNGDFIIGLDTSSSGLVIGHLDEDNITGNVIKDG